MERVWKKEESVSIMQLTDVQIVRKEEKGDRSRRKLIRREKEGRADTAT